MNAKLYKTEKENYVLVDPTKGTYDDGYTLGTSRESQYNKLSIKNCQAIERGYDLDELAEKHYDVHIKRGHTKEDSLQRKIDFILGFQKALEILGDKKFSGDDIRKAYTTGWNSCNNFTGYDENQEFIELPDCIQSLQQTEWDVEIEMETPGATYGHSGWHKEPKLDAKLSIILKRK